MKNIWIVVQAIGILMAFATAYWVLAPDGATLLAAKSGFATALGELISASIAVALLIAIGWTLRKLPDSKRPGNNSD